MLSQTREHVMAPTTAPTCCRRLPISPSWAALTVSTVAEAVATEAPCWTTGLTVVTFGPADMPAACTAAGAWVVPMGFGAGAFETSFGWPVAAEGDSKMQGR